MTPEQAKASYRRQLAQHGELVVFQRGTVTFPANGVPAIAVRVTGFAPNDVTGSVQQGERRVCVLVEDLDAAGMPLPVRDRDTILWNGKVLRVTSVDDATARIGGVLVAYWLVVAGA